MALRGPSSSPSRRALPLPPSCSKRGQDALDTREDAVLVLPVEVIELREVVRVEHVLERESRAEPAGQLEHLAPLKGLELAEELFLRIASTLPEVRLEG